MIVELSHAATKFMDLTKIRNDLIVDETIKLFFTSSISNVTMKEIAAKADIGEASLYRYFKHKKNIVLAASLKLQSQISSNYFDLNKGVNGLDKLTIFYNSYLDIFKESTSYYKFINEFDAYMLEEDFLDSSYEDNLNIFKNSFMDAYKLGVEDCSIKNIEDIETFYYSSTHALLELCKKLSSDKKLLNQDKLSNKEGEIKTLINVLISYLKPCEPDASKK